MTSEPEQPPISSPSRWVRARNVALTFSVLLWVGVGLCYWRRPDAGAAVTIWPAWMWAVLGMLLAGLGWQKRRKRPFLVVSLLWLLTLLLFAEEATSLARVRSLPPGWETLKQRGRALRVVALNCAGGSKEAAAEVIGYHPDLVLLSETPVRREVEALAKRLYGAEAGVAFGMDTSLIARGHVTLNDLPLRLRGSFVGARVRLISGLEMEVISLRLLPPVFREDLWNPECWRQHSENRQARREQLRALLPTLNTLPQNVPMLIGGDWNAPAGDAIFRLLPARLHDTFAESGVGWGNTVINEIPLLRIDQVWASESLRAVCVRAHTTANSDHRLVVADLILR